MAPAATPGVCVISSKLHSNCNLHNSPGMAYVLVVVFISRISFSYVASWLRFKVFDAHTYNLQVLTSPCKFKHAHHASCKSLQVYSFAKYPAPRPLFPLPSCKLDKCAIEFVILANCFGSSHVSLHKNAIILPASPLNSPRFAFPKLQPGSH